MKIVTVTPVNKGVFKDKLTYFSSLDLKPGTIVSAPLGNRKIEALVLETKNLKDVRSEIKSSDFSLKKIDTVLHENFFLPEFLAAANEIADYFATNLGQAIKSMTPKMVLSGLGESHGRGKKNISVSHPAPEATNVKTQNRLVLQQPDEERFSFYKSLIRETFAKKQSVFLCLPNIIEVEKAAKLFEKGIGGFTIAIHSGLPQKKIIESWQRALETDHPILFIATPLFLSLPRHDFGIFICDRESSSGFKDLSRPFIDFRIFLELYTEKTGAKLILGGNALRSETIYQTEKGHFSPISPLKYRAISSSRQTIIDSKKEKVLGQKEIDALSTEAVELIKEAVENREKIFIFCGRKGLAPMTVCNDCGNIVLCPNCSSPLVVHKGQTFDESKNRYFYLCHKCGLQTEVSDKCPNCSSWRLTLLGHGTQKVEDELSVLLPDYTILKIDSDTSKNQKKIKETVEKFMTQKATLLLGTELAIPYLEEKIDNIFVVSFDAIFSIPDFRISEKALGTLFNLKQLSGRRFVIQTRHPEEKVYEYTAKSNLLDFYRDEIAERRELNYPPFKLLIKISKTGKRTETISAMKLLEQKLQDYEPAAYPSMSQGEKSGYTVNILLRLDSDKWVDEDLLSTLRSLSPDYVVDVQPENIL